MVKTIDMLESLGTGIGRWLRVAFVIFIILFFILLVVRPYYLESKQINKMEQNANKTNNLNKTCLAEIGKIECAKSEKELYSIEVEPTTYQGIFTCNDNLVIKITSEQLNDCSRS